MEVYGQQNRGAGGGWETEYEIQFEPISEGIGTIAAGRVAVGKAINRLGTLISLIDTKPVGPNRPIRDVLKCGLLDSKLEEEYKESGYKAHQRLTPEQAKKSLDQISKNHPEMRELYPSPEQILQEAEKNSKNDWFYQLRPED